MHFHLNTCILSNTAVVKSHVKLYANNNQMWFIAHFHCNESGVGHYQHLSQNQQYRFNAVRAWLKRSSVKAKSEKVTMTFRHWVTSL